MCTPLLLWTSRHTPFEWAGGWHRYFQNAISCTVADEGVLKKLDSSVKRNTALIKKVRQVNEDTREGLLDDIRRTNQSKVGGNGGSLLYSLSSCLPYLEGENASSEN